MDFDKMAINAAVEALLKDPFDTDAASVIIQFGNALPECKRTIHHSIHTTKTTGGSVTGHTREHGNVTVPHDHEETKETTKGVTFERVGFYKFFRYKSIIFFQYFWKSDITTLGTEEEPPTYSIFYNQTTLEYEGIFERTIKLHRSYRFFGISRQIFQMFWKSLKTGEETYTGRMVVTTKHISR